MAQAAPAVLPQHPHNAKSYVFESAGCPACRHLKETLLKRMKEDSVVFVEASLRENGEKMLTLYSIPLTVIVVGEELAGSVISAMEADSWQYVINESLKTGKFMIADADEGHVHGG